MGLGKLKYVSLAIVLGILLTSHVYSQNQSILDFTIKNLDGDSMVLREKLDPNTNYVIETMAFWCNPCIKSIDRFNYHKNYWKERFNTDILLIEDEHWDDLEYVENKIQEYEWDIACVVSNDQFGTVGINSIPRYFFKGAAVDTVERIYGNIEKFLLERVDSIKFTPILDYNFNQGTLTKNCDQLNSVKYNSTQDTLINGRQYQLFGGIPFRESGQNGNIIRYNLENDEEQIHIKYSAALCSRVWMKDMDGDSLLVRILDRYQEDSILHLVTDQRIINECSGDTIPFEIIQDVGTNAGFLFDIEDGNFKSLLICHKKEGEIIYADDELEHMCLTLSIDQVISPWSIQIYPNPAQSKIKLNFDFKGSKQIEVFTISGQKLVSEFTGSERHEIHLPATNSSTLLIVRISTPNGVVSKKITRINN